MTQAEFNALAPDDLVLYDDGRRRMMGVVIRKSSRRAGQWIKFNGRRRFSRYDWLPQLTKIQRIGGKDDQSR
jgi:hypothetical protein